MSETSPTDKLPSDKDPAEQARQGLDQAEGGDAAGADQLDKARTRDPADAEAVEQAATEGPEGRGLSR